MHKSVLLQEVIDSLSLAPGDRVIDATAGAGGHSRAILQKIGESGKLLAIDKDKNALILAQKVIGRKDNVFFEQADFAEVKKLSQKHGPDKVDGIIVDLGVSSMQLDEPDRGFSFSKHAPLDMRMNQEESLSAKDIVNTYTEDELTTIFRKYGEEKDARLIARAIAKERESGQIIWTDQLAEVVRRVKRGSQTYKKGVWPKTKIDPATKVFQALRIETNKELFALESALPQMIGLLAKGGRMGVISFHSLEDRIVKHVFDQEAKSCICPPEYPVCRCEKRPRLKILNKKPIIAKEGEIARNIRSRSAKLRVAEKI